MVDRYGLLCEYGDDGSPEAKLFPAVDGKAVLFADHEREIRTLTKSLQRAIAERDAADDLLQTMELAYNALREVHESSKTEKGELIDEVIALITTEQAAMNRLYERHSYGINKVCNRLKLFVGDLLKKPKSPTAISAILEAK